MAENKVTTVFQIDKTQFDKSIKDLNKSVEQAKKQFGTLSNEAKGLSKELSTIGDQIKDINGLSNLANDIDKCTSGIKKANKEFTALNKQITSAQKTMKNIGDVNLSDVKQLQNILKSLKNYDVIKESDLKDAVNDAKEIAKQLNSIQGIDTSGLDRRINSISNNNASTSAIVNGDTERYLRKIYTSLSEVQENVKDKNSNKDIVDSIDILRKKLEDAVSKSAKSLIRAMGSNSSGNNNIATPTVKSDNPFGTDEITTIVKLYEQLKESERQFNVYLGITENEMREISRVFAEQCKQADKVNEILEQQTKTQNKLRNATEETADESRELADNINDATQNSNKLHSVYEALSNLLQKVGIKLPDLGEINQTGDSLKNLSNALSGIRSTSGSASSGMAGFGASASAVTAVVLGLVAAVIAYVAALKKCIDAMKKASEVARDFEDATAKLANQLGVTSEGVNKLRDSLNEAFRNQGYTTDINEMAEAVRVLQQQLNINVDSDYGQQMLNRLMAVSQTTGYEMKELGKAINAVSNNFEVSQEEALDGIMYMFQTTGDEANDLLDTMSEYSMKVKDMNMSFETFMAGIKAGDMASLFNTDKVGQLFEELNDTLTTEADKATESLNKIGVSYSKVMKGIKSGGSDAQDAFYAIIEGINNVEDVAKRQQIVSELFKSPGQEVSLDFFNLLEEARVSMEELSGTADKVSNNIANTFTYQMNRAQNNFASAWDKVGEQVNNVVTPILKAFNDNFDSIMEAVETELAPAFYDLAIAIASAFNIDTPKNFADGLVGVVEGLASVIRFIALITFGIGKIVSVVRILWNIIQMLFDGIKAGIVLIGTIIASFVDTVIHAIVLIANTIKELLIALKDSLLDILAWVSKKLVWLLEAIVTSVVDAIALIFKGAGNILVSLVTSFDDAFMLILKAAGNLGLGICNAIVIGAKKAYNGFLDFFVNPAIRAANLLPGVDIKEVGKVSETGAFEYISIKNELAGLKDAWTNPTFDVSKDLNEIVDVWKKGGDVGKDEASRIGDVWGNFADKVSSGYDKINKDYMNWESEIWSTGFGYLEQIGENINKNADDIYSLMTGIGMGFDEYKQSFENAFTTQTESESDNANKIVNAINNSGNSNNTDKYAGKDPLPTKGSSSGSKKKGTSKKDTSKKEAEKAQKEYEDALKKAQQAQYDFYKNLIDAYFEAQDKMIGYETSIAEQRWSAMEEGRELYEDQIAFYESIMKKYILTTDQMIEYTEQKYDAALQLRNWALSEAQKLIEEQTELELEAIEKEKDALIDANNEKIKEYKKYIREIERQISDLEDQWDKEDREQEIDKVKAELEKYASASSVEGIKKRNELTERLNELLKEKERDQIKDRLEDQKDGWQEQIDGLEDANEEIENEYDNRYKEVQEIVKDGELTIADIQETIRDTSNTKLKEQLQEMVDAYESAMKSMQESTLNIQTILQWQNKEDAMNNTIAGLTGETSKPTLDINKKLNPDYVKIKELQEKWNALADGKNSSNPKIKAEQDKLHAQAEAIRAKYGLKYPNLPPMYLDTPKYHTGGIVQGKGEVDAKLMGGEVVFTQKQFQNVIDFFDYFNPVNLLPSMKASPLQGYSNQSVVYNDSLSITMENVNLHGKMDVKQMMQEMESVRKIQTQSRGKRKL